jgi:enterochelin esterase-like enzyme
MVEGSLDTDLSNFPLEFLVYLPPCYDQEPERRYPVLYLIHGQGFTQDQWDRLGADEMADQLIAAGEASPFIIVMPRDRVWTPPTEDLFGQAVIEILLPHIDETYRTIPERDHRAIGGLSRGAGWALRLGLINWEQFGIIGMHSLPILWGDGGSIPRWLDDIPSDSMPRMYLDIGDHDRAEITESATWFSELLAERQIAHEFYVFTGYHDEAYWSAHVEQYLRFYALEW